jgi:hypothetical protein
MLVGSCTREDVSNRCEI